VGELNGFLKFEGLIGKLILDLGNALGDGSVVPADYELGGFTSLQGEPLTELGFSGAAFSIVPEPGTLMLLGAGLVGLAASRRARG
jgi:hypothetical protein